VLRVAADDSGAATLPREFPFADRPTRSTSPAETDPQPGFQIHKVCEHRFGFQRSISPNLPQKVSGRPVNTSLVISVPDLRTSCSAGAFVRREIMKHILRVITLSLTVGIAATVMAAPAPMFESPQEARVSAKSNFKRPHHHRVRRHVYGVYSGRTKVIRVRRLSRPQVREFYRRMLDIYAN
jgi:hypothetical protein